MRFFKHGTANYRDDCRRATSARNKPSKASDPKLVKRDLVQRSDDAVHDLLD